eukprot:CAMPEP_0114255164 /NCGR_PEP_ID=MMETSP0058-20121206/17401_1 /TAXON_ID=36894 /ORGANISM="Pyramimonas parkeae, CCMP726" /LENGTH=135 /DNA_ID=CAMNT_0001369501 /DNA_START=238 /DNA_END=641 /DNA_ORIENTATION=+
MTKVPMSQHTIRLEGRNLEDIPKEVFNRDKLQSLLLARNYITQIGPSISTLHNLKTLDLSHNRITVIAPEIGTLAALQELNLEGNLLESLPPQLGGLLFLTGLNLHRNPLSAGTCSHGPPLATVWSAPGAGAGAG